MEKFGRLDGLRGRGCPLCGVDALLRGEWFEHHDCGQVDTANPEKVFQIVRCCSCGLMLTWPRPRKEDVVAYYTGSGNLYGGSGYNVAGEDRGVFEWTLARLSRLGAPSKVLFDVGAGRGQFVQYARKAGFDAHGLECSADLVEIGRRDGLSLEQGDFACWQPRADPVGIVSFRDVLEHMLDPVAALRKANRILLPRGLLYVKVPNADFCHGPLRLLGLRRFYPFVHLNHFERTSLTRVLRATGFEPVLWDVEPPSRPTRMLSSAGYVVSKVLTAAVQGAAHWSQFALCCFARRQAG